MQRAQLFEFHDLEWFPVAVRDALTDFMSWFATSFRVFRPIVPILRDAVRCAGADRIVEYTERNFWIWGLPLLLTPLFAMLMMPFVRPFKASHLLWTYLFPMVPLVSAWDGVVSCLRTYSPSELLALAAESDGGKYEWRSGRVRAFGACRVTYLVGWPRGASNESGRAGSSVTIFSRD
jgi:hypothetical protein